MLFWLWSLWLGALSLTFSESFVNANYTTFINFINFRDQINEGTVAKILIKFFQLANNFGTSKRIKFGWHESNTIKCQIVKPIAFLKEDWSKFTGAI